MTRPEADPAARAGPDLAPDLAPHLAPDLPPDMAPHLVPDLRDRALQAAGSAFTLSDMRLPDAPLVHVNPAFTRMTGYAARDVLGRNCRFLQTVDTDPQAVRQVRDAIRLEQHLVVVLLNARRDGTTFWNELSLSPVHDDDGALTHYVGIQSDVTERVLAERRLELLIEATDRLAATLDVDESLQRLCELVVPALGDWCRVELLPDDGVRRAVAARQESAGRLWQRSWRESTADPGPTPAVAQVLGAAGSGPVERIHPQLVHDLPADLVTALLGDGDTPAGAAEDRPVDHVPGAPAPTPLPQDALAVPLRARSAALGALVVGRATQPRPYDVRDLAAVGDLARRAALAVDNARLFSAQRDVAEALQRSLLPQLAEVAGLEHAARYLPGSTAAQVGGDWYDLLALPDGAVGVAVGDVMGHDVAAAAAMGQLRSVLRSYAWQGARPAEVLDGLDRLVQGLQMARLATAVYARLELPRPGEPGRLVLADAGHLPPVLRGPDGPARLLDGVSSVLVGAAPHAVREELTVEVPPGSTLVLCTDGLLERRGADLDQRLEAMRAAVQELPAQLSADAACDVLLDALAAQDSDDDVGLLVVRVLAPDPTPGTGTGTGTGTGSTGQASNL